jgi:hypothetical protein
VLAGKEIPSDVQKTTGSRRQRGASTPDDTSERDHAGELVKMRLEAFTEQVEITHGDFALVLPFAPVSLGFSHLSISDIVRKPHFCRGFDSVTALRLVECDGLGHFTRGRIERNGFTGALLRLASTVLRLD